MKKILKNASLSIIVLVVLFGFTKNVYAGCKLNSSECDPRNTTTYGNIYVTGDPIGRIRDSWDSQVTWTSKHFVGPSSNIHSQDANWHQFWEAGVSYHASRGSNGFSSYADSHNVFLYCYDIHKVGYGSLYAKRFLINGPSANPNVEAFDYGMMAILTDGSNAASNSAMATYWPKLAAVRALLLTFGYLSGETSSRYSTDIYALSGTVYSWLTANNNALYNKLVNAGLQVSSLSKIRSLSAGYYSGTGAARAKALFEKGINEAIDAYGTLKNKKSVSVKEVDVPVYNDKETVEAENGDTIIKQDIIHKISVTGLVNEGSTLVLNNPTYTSGEAPVGMTVNPTITKVVINDKTYGKEAVGVDLKKLTGLDFSNEVVIEVTVHLEGRKEAFVDPDAEDLEGITPSDVLNCGQQPIEYDLKLDYDTKETTKYDNYVGVIWQSTGVATQRYVAVYPAAGNNQRPTNYSFTSHAATNFIPVCSCTDLEKACKEEFEDTGDLEGTNCQILKKSKCGECSWLDVQCDLLTGPEQEEACNKKAENCEVECVSEIEEMSCCDANNELYFGSGDEVDNQKVNIYGLSPDEDGVKACFVNQVDNLCAGAEDSETNNCAGVEVKDDKDNAFTLASMNGNKYCSVSCKEDYVMNMPTAKLVNAGRYFTFKARVEGTKACYTNTIDRDQFNEDMEEAQKALVDAYNEYEFWRQAAAVTSTVVSDSCHAASCSGCSGGCSSCTPPTSCHHWSCSACSAQGQEVTKEWNFTMYDYDGNSSGSVNSYVAPNGKTYDGNYSDGRLPSCGCCSCTGDMGHNPDSDHAENAKKALNALHDAMKNYDSIINDYNACSGSDWVEDAKIKYKPNVYYDYEEEYLDKFGLVGEMDETKTDPTAEEWYCNYTMISGGMINENYVPTIDANYEKCNSGTTTKSSSTINYLYCNESGCSTKSEQISDAKYKKVTSKVTADYKPKTLFYNVYPSGEIVINKADDNVPLENKLPVALNTERAIYKYVVNIEDLGEFYNVSGDDNLGRYNAYATDDKDAPIEYYCSYLVNIPTTDGWVCDFDENCTDNCIANCQGPNCGDDRFCDGINCVAECVGMGCIYDSTVGNSFLERTVTLNKLFPNGTSSYNWSRDDNDKAADTIDEIEKGIDGKYAGDGIFESQPILSLTITPKAATAIRNYNRDAEKDNGGYSNATLSCYSLTVNGANYSEIACYSNFISDLLDGEVDGQNVGDIVNDVSQIVKPGFRTVTDNNYEYFTGWQNVSDLYMLGPSWK